LEDEIRTTGIDTVGKIPWGTHFCQFYQTRGDLIDILVPYFKAGLENNEFCMWVTSKPLELEDAKTSLKHAVGDSHIARGQIEILDASQWYIKSGRFEADAVLYGWVEKLNGAAERGFDGLRVSGNTTWLTRPNWKRFADYEMAMDDLIGKYRMLVLCCYSLDKCRASDVLHVLSHHRFALTRQEDKWETIGSTRRRQRR
jgi:hypothetical protein